MKLSQRDKDMKNNKKQPTDIKVRTWRLNVYVMGIAVLKIEKMEKQQQNNNLLFEDLPDVKKTSYPIKIAQNKIKFLPRSIRVKLQNTKGKEILKATREDSI